MDATSRLAPLHSYDNCLTRTSRTDVKHCRKKTAKPYPISKKEGKEKEKVYLLLGGIIRGSVEGKQKKINKGGYFKMGGGAIR